jgi:Protein of unknown function (DUF3035)
MLTQILGWRMGMRPRYAALVAALLASATLGACASDKTPNLMNLRSDSNGPDEFAILPVKPLELPKDLAALPDPTPNGTNLVDPNPMGDAVVALGGKPRDPKAGSAADNGLVSYAARGGVTENVREVLAAEDLEYRKRNNGRLLERLFKVTTYFKSYSKQALNQNAELARWRAQGVATPSAPPVQ